MRLEDIGFYTLSDHRASQASVDSVLWRCELILTDRCNFKCPYCRGMREDCRGEMPFEYAEMVIRKWCSHGLKNIRLSGGEPTLYPRIGRLIEMARDGGVEHIAISTNGSASGQVYDNLIAKGVNDFSISLDACCSAFGKKMSGGACKWDDLIENIRNIASATYCTVGIVFTEQNVTEAREIIEFAHGLGVADIRVISAAQYDQAITALADLPDEILDAHPILKYRVTNHLNRRNVRGILEMDSRTCPLAMDDMAVAGRWHFPCIIYLREHGNPIGSIEDPMMKVRWDRWVWAHQHDCHDDPICRKNCLDVCVDYNNRVMELA